jgi:hypothetical protein
MRNSNLGPILNPSLNSSFFKFCTCCWAILGAKNSLVGQEESEFKLGCHFRLKLEFGFFLIASIVDLLLAPKVVQWHMKNSKFKLVSHFEPCKLEIDFFFRHFQTTCDTKSSSTMLEEFELELGSHLGPKFELKFFFVYFCNKPC